MYNKENFDRFKSERLKFFNPDENREQKNLLVELLPAGKAEIPIVQLLQDKLRVSGS